MVEMRKELSKLSSMETTLNNINAKVTTLETKVNQVEQVAGNCEKSCEFLNSTFEIQKKELIAAKTSITDLKNRCDGLEKEAAQHEKQKQKVQDKLNDLESRSMREKLLFLAIEENQNEDCIQLVKTFCEDELLISHTVVENIAVDRAHRMGRVKVGSIRPIVVKFHKHSDRELIREKASELRNILKGKNYTV